MYGERLRRLRKAHGYTLEEVGNRIGIAKTTYGGYETEEKKPPLDKLKKFAVLYDVSVDYILGLTDNPEPNVERNDIKEFLEKSKLHWNGRPLSEEELKPIRDLLEIVVRDRLPQVVQDGKKNNSKKNKALE